MYFWKWRPFSFTTWLILKFFLFNTSCIVLVLRLAIAWVIFFSFCKLEMSTLPKIQNNLPSFIKSIYCLPFILAKWTFIHCQQSITKSSVATSNIIFFQISKLTNHLRLNKFIKTHFILPTDFGLNNKCSGLWKRFKDFLPPLKTFQRFFASTAIEWLNDFCQLMI